jgi:hypothetical protein
MPVMERARRSDRLVNAFRRYAAPRKRASGRNQRGSSGFGVVDMHIVNISDAETRAGYRAGVLSFSS